MVPRRQHTLHSLLLCPVCNGEGGVGSESEYGWDQPECDGECASPRRSNTLMLAAVGDVGRPLRLDA